MKLHFTCAWGIRHLVKELQRAPSGSARCTVKLQKYCKTMSALNLILFICTLRKAVEGSRGGNFQGIRSKTSHFDEKFLLSCPRLIGMLLNRYWTSHGLQHRRTEEKYHHGPQWSTRKTSVKQWIPQIIAKNKRLFESENQCQNDISPGLFLHLPLSRSYSVTETHYFMSTFIEEWVHHQSNLTIFSSYLIKRQFDLTWPLWINRFSHLLTDNANCETRGPLWAAVRALDSL